MGHAGNGNNVLRGGFGIFYNRNMGNLEYDYLRIPPTSYAVSTNSGSSSALADGVGLTYDTIRQLDWTTRGSSLTINTLNPDSNKWPTTYSFSVSRPADLLTRSSRRHTSAREDATS